MQILLESRQLEKAIGDRRLFAIPLLRIGERDRIGIVGRNGAGKTTLLKILAGVERPDEGTIETRATRYWLPQLKPDAGSLSGGEATGKAIDEAFARDADLLLADEPTMHLDVERIAKLESQLDRYRGAVVVVSHDRAFLDRTCSRIWALEGKTVTAYKGNYTDYLARKREEREQHQAKYEAYVEKKKQLEHAVRLKARKADKMMKPPSRMGTSESRLYKMEHGTKQKEVHRVIRSIETRLAKLERVEKPRELPSVKMDIPNAALIRNKKLIAVERAEASANGRTLWADVTLRVSAGEKVALIGPNGAGKTTFLRRLVRGDDGFSVGANAKLGYFSQNLDLLDPERTVIENVLETSVHTESLVRSVLARLLFRQDDVFKRVKDLSGGERVKVAFAKVLLSDMNVLVMDEPTTFLDLQSVESLEELLREYEGTLLFVSHDRQFVGRVATRILAIEDGRIVSFSGTYEAYEEAKRTVRSGSRQPIEEALMVTETKLTEVMGKLGMQPTAAEAGALEESFRALIGERNRLRQALNKK
ncbi:ribosomal protection-like ABC-F family protein [Cohnella nanjingensis]|uniref:ABC-F family ATP-binding cassette domain-containing protein n=1 Tax=Cohnella nanjingensis TaxID=1387779 RepID=A0A7X0RPG9_9BACL|nr:ABC-F family ATP-binding cassette domain-containing protein [Cohnella nanjingensis]MBB6671307.1 ABC-F family ATP-binding cassette domain-containing protein [Cohnella nanjingensis]